MNYASNTACVTPDVQPKYTNPISVTKARKRHKVATSCNRCRQNKRKCDNGVPCSNCKRNNVDCCYTDAQISRTIWGDLPLSRDKVIGVAANRPRTTSSIKSIILPYYPPGSSGSRPMFDPRLLPDNHQSRSQQVLSLQSKNLSKTIRIAHQGPQYPQQSYLNESMTNSFSEQPHSIEVKGPGALSSVSTFNSTLNEQQVSKVANDKPNKPQSKGNQRPDLGSRSNSLNSRSRNQAEGGLKEQQYADTISGKLSDLSSSNMNNRNFQECYTKSSLVTQNLPSAVHNDISHNFHSVATTEESSAPLTMNPNVESIPSMRTPTFGIGPATLLPMSYPTSQTANYENTTFTHRSDRLVPSDQLQPNQYKLTTTEYQRHYDFQSSPIYEGVFPQFIPSTYSTTSSPNSPSSTDPVHTIHSAMAIPSITDLSSNQYDPLGPWGTLTPGSQDYSAIYKDDQTQAYYHDNRQHQQAQHIQLDQNTFSSLNHSEPIEPYNTEAGKNTIDENNKISKKIQKIARDILAIKKYDLCIFVRRHISQEYDDLFLPSELPSASMRIVPSHLMLLPRDANYLVDVFFEYAHFYYPIINRSIVELHLMEPQSPQAMFLLNIVFMTACKHLARNSDIKRAIQFRNRAKEVSSFIDDKSRLSRIQGILLCSVVIYGVFKTTTVLAELCGAHRALNTMPWGSDEEEVHIQVDPAMKRSVPEAAYQARLWAFWGLYIRDATSRLYFGWPHGMDPVEVTSDLPKLEGHVGLGGNGHLKSRLDEYRQVPPPVIGKRRGSTFKRKDSKKSEKRHMTRPLEDGGANMVKTSDKANYRNTLLSSDDDDDDEADDDINEHDVTDLDWDERRRSPLFQQGVEPLLVMSPKILEQQCQPSYYHSSSFVGHHLGRSTFTPLSSEQKEHDIHMSRVKTLIDAEEDPTDGGSFARILFLEEIRLWTIGRRVAFYLAGRSNVTAPSACPTPQTKGSTHSTSDTQHNTDQWSEEAWLQDHELQSLQADLIAWENALPIHLRFRQDLDSEGINHKVNGKMSILIMTYYTITIMLQSSFLPISQYFSSRKSSSQASPIKQRSEERGMEATKKATSIPTVNNPNTLPSPEIPVQASSTYMPTATTPEGAAPSTYFMPQPQSNSPQPQKSLQGHLYFNTAHRICTELSNVIMHHVELMLDFYPDWCSIQAKVNHALTAALRVTCLNAKLRSNSSLARDEAMACFKMGSELYRRLALLPYPLVIRDWPAEEDVQAMMEIEEEFREMMMTEDEQQAVLPSTATNSFGATGSEGIIEVPEPIDTVDPNSLITLVPNDAEQQTFGLFEGDYKFDFEQPL
ncbi:hypothetical protein BGZ49_001588 [Haplosporangium sp. Z 27]|nr:hypothetical protein BGZ49_001588 [Haplosporangium sp. Z 27]